MNYDSMTDSYMARMSMTDGEVYNECLAERLEHEHITRLEAFGIDFDVELTEDQKTIITISSSIFNEAYERLKK